MKRLQQIAEGTAKCLYASDREDVLILAFKDEAAAFGGLKKGTIAGKGVIDSKICGHLYRLLEREGIPTHYVEELPEGQLAVRSVDMLPLEVIVRNRAAGSFSRRLGIAEGSELSAPVVEFCYKNEELGDPVLGDDGVIAIGLATQEELLQIRRMAKRINRFLTGLFQRIEIELIDFKLEFGRYQGELLLADEISPDTCRLWDRTTHEKLDKDRFRRDLGDAAGAYQEVWRRLGLS